MTGRRFSSFHRFDEFYVDVPGTAGIHPGVHNVGYTLQTPVDADRVIGDVKPFELITDRASYFLLVSRILRAKSVGKSNPEKLRVN